MNSRTCLVFAVVAVLVLLVSSGNASLLREWQRSSSEHTGDVAPDLTFSLKPRNAEWLRAEAFAVSNPSSESYGRRYSLDSLAKLIAPNPELLQELIAFVTEELGCPSELLVVAPTRDSVTAVSCPITRVEERLAIRYSIFRHVSSKRAVLRASFADQTGSNKLAYLEQLPPNLRAGLSTVTGIHELFSMPHEKKGYRSLLANLRSRSAPSDNSPDILPALAIGANTLSVSVIVYCKNGQRTQNPASLCSDFPPVITQLTTYLSNVDNIWTDTVQLSFNSDNNSSGHCAAIGSVNGVVCSFPERSIPTYRRVQVSADAVYSDGSKSNTSTFVTRVAPTDYTTTKLVHQLYNIPTNIRVTNEQTTQAVAAFEGQYISLEDLSLFLTNMGVHQQNITVVGPNDQTQPGGESSLDIQSIIGVAPGAPTTFWSVAGNVKAQGEYILKFFQQLNADPNAPLVSSISYGDTEDGYFNNYGSWDYINQCEVELQKLALRRRTIVSGSGDAGASNVGEDGNDISHTDPTCTPFRPFYPADSPFVTGVSATFLGNEALPVCRGQKLFGQPIVCDDVGEIAVSVSDGLFWTTGGGFSSYFGRSDYQAEAVDSFLTDFESSLPPSAYWNSTGQGYPDVSAIGHQLVCWIGGVAQPVDGTSMASPIFAALITLLNDYVMNKGGAPLGFVNPMLYALASTHPQVFNDIVVGSNADGDWQQRDIPYPTLCKFGFNCQPGWDAVTGLGSLNYQEILPLLPIVPVADI